MFRSEEMALCQLFIQPEAAYSSLSILGEMGIAQFRDLNSSVNPFMRKFVNEVRRCDELERKLRYIEEEVKKEDVPIPALAEIPSAPNPREIIDLEAHLEKTETEMMELSQNSVNLRSNFKELKEMMAVLEKAQTFMAEQEESDSNRALIGNEERGRLGFIAGVIPRERVAGFERMLWRVSRGNVFLRQQELEEPLEDPTTGQDVRKNVFVAFYQGDNLKTRLKKVCVGYHASLYNCPSSVSEREGIINELRIRLEDLKIILEQTTDHKHRVLVAVAKELKTWAVMVRKMKAIYHTLNMFNMDVTNKCLIAECWVPKDDLHRVRRALEDGGKAVGSSINSFVHILVTSEQPPSYIRTNRFTQGFQNLIDAYAVSSYREVNPAAFTIISFPFLFAIMFGDFGHGIIVTIFATWMCLFEKKLAEKRWGEIWSIFFSGRYIILLMGIFSMYTGLLYNDMFSLSLNIWGSAWNVNYNDTTLLDNGKLTLDPATSDFRGHPFYFGLDPAWQFAENKIIFLNSFKMKISIVIAVLHMLLGICLSVVNAVHMKKLENIFFDFIPQTLFLLLLFGYLAFMIVFKYFTYYSTMDESQVTVSSRCAPSVLITFINMVLFSPNQKVWKCDAYMFAGQQGLQSAFVLLALACVPVMLFGKPTYYHLKKKRKAKAKAQAHQHQPLTNGSVDVMRASSEDGEALQTPPPMAVPRPPQGEHHDPEDEEFSEIMVHQAIHTVEYVLSTVSHTASYLRLWALSLAHAQLSDVLWDMVFRKGMLLSYSLAFSGTAAPSFLGGFVVYIVFWPWVALTVSVLVLMEGLSAFLHTLRLHWVEFMSKFYIGTGHAFEPFCFKRVIVDESELD